MARKTAKFVRYSACALVVAILGLVFAFTWSVPSESAAVRRGNSGAAASTDYQSQLEALGRAYAQTWGLTLIKVQAVPAGAISASDQQKLAEELQQALLVGYAPRKGTFLVLPYSQLSGVMKVTMAGGRSPSEVVKALIVPGTRIVGAEWDFSGAEHIESVAIFSANGDLSFDTLLFLPVIQGPLLEPAP